MTSTLPDGTVRTEMRATEIPQQADQEDNKWDEPSNETAALRPGLHRPSGRSRFYFRRKGHSKVALPGLPWSTAFMAKYQEAMSMTSRRPLQIGADRVVPRSIRALAIAYYDSASFKALNPITQGVYRNIIDRFCRETDKDGQPYGDKSAVTMKSHHIEKLMAARAGKPDSANGLRKVLREMMKVAKRLGWREDDPTQGVKKIKPKKKGGFHRWTDAEIAQFETRHPVGSRARLGDGAWPLHRTGRQDVIRDGRTAHQPRTRS